MLKNDIEGHFLHLYSTINREREKKNQEELKHASSLYLKIYCLSAVLV